MFFKSNTAKSPMDYMVVGLGNPGTEYENTRHNAGYLAIDTICKELNIKPDRLKFKSICCDTMIGDKRVLFLKPTTYMNLSGEAVLAARDFYKIPNEHIIVIYDDISLEPGKLRIRQKGSHGGHNGIKSITLLTGSENFPRIKLGIGAKPHPDYDLAKWVLSKFSKDDMTALQASLDNCLDIITLIINGKISEAMNKYN